jgi:hypothetical protein
VHRPRASQRVGQAASLQNAPEFGPRVRTCGASSSRGNAARVPPERRSGRAVVFEQREQLLPLLELALVALGVVAVLDERRRAEEEVRVLR